MHDSYNGSTFVLHANRVSSILTSCTNFNGFVAQLVERLVEAQVVLVQVRAFPPFYGSEAY